MVDKSIKEWSQLNHTKRHNRQTNSLFNEEWFAVGIFINSHMFVLSRIMSNVCVRGDVRTTINMNLKLASILWENGKRLKEILLWKVSHYSITVKYKSSNFILVQLFSRYNSQTSEGSSRRHCRANMNKSTLKLQVKSFHLITRWSRVQWVNAVVAHRTRVLIV